ncbi:unnamed protein product [Cylicostephanus goldi]|uniref:Uncharacterized protein n=1 Tax=Cylicostephanus goldi TaxID=71465 RepID=A0A3P7MRJ2_CYLGO|nr:unnamed protein product [Cylicostephanus goldi]
MITLSDAKVARRVDCSPVIIYYVEDMFTIQEDEVKTDLAQCHNEHHFRTANLSWLYGCGFARREAALLDFAHIVP